MALCSLLSQLQWKIIILCKYETTALTFFLPLPTADHSDKFKNRHIILNDNIHCAKSSMLLVPEQATVTKIITVSNPIKNKIKQVNSTIIK